MEFCSIKQFLPYFFYIIVVGIYIVGFLGQIQYYSYGCVFKPDKLVVYIKHSAHYHCSNMYSSYIRHIVTSCKLLNRVRFIDSLVNRRYDGMYGMYWLFWRSIFAGCYPRTTRWTTKKRIIFARRTMPMACTRVSTCRLRVVTKQSYATPLRTWQWPMGHASTGTTTIPSANRKARTHSRALYRSTTLA